MIKSDEYLKALKTVKDYEEQEKYAKEVKAKEDKLKQQKREDECGEHYYLPDGGKYSSSSQRSCQFCGKTIN